MKPLTKPFHLAGVKYSDEHKLSHATPASIVRISHDPTNKYDAFALRVTIDDVFVGHVPRTDQAAWFYHTLNQVTIVPRLVKFDRNVPPHEQIQIVLECDEKYMTVVIKVGRISA